MENENNVLENEETKVLKMQEELKDLLLNIDEIDEDEIVKNPIDAIFDEDNNDPIYLYSENGKLIGFEQIALIPLKAATYVILKPMEQIDGVGEDEGLVFEIKYNDEGLEYLMLVTDEKVIDDVFDVYDELVESENTETEDVNSDKTEE